MARVPEEIEIDTDKIEDDVREQLEREGGSLLKAIALTTALFAALAAVAALQAGGTVNEALVLKTEATRLQAEASDQWAEYQAKGIKAEIREASEAIWAAQGKESPASLKADRDRYARERTEIQAAARKLERERDVKSEEADALLRRHHKFADSVALFQVAIALGAVAALARFRLVWFLSMVLGLGGAALFLTTML